jgi:hypothetical protein
MSQTMGSRDGWADQLNGTWTEFSISLGAAPSGHQFAVLRKRLSTSVAVLQTIRSDESVWTHDEFDNILNVFHQAMYEHMTSMTGLQLTLQDPE